jgi:hypothetical protein
MPKRLLTFALACGAIALVGCGPAKLNESRTWKVESGVSQALDLPAISKPQKINVEFSSSDGEVLVAVFKEEDAKGEEGLLNADTNVKKALASKTSKGETFTADVPENTPTRVIVYSKQKNTTVNLKVTN